MDRIFRRVIRWLGVCALVACTSGEIGPEEATPSTVQSDLGGCDYYRECVLWFNQGFEYEYACNCDRPEGFWTYWACECPLGAPGLAYVDQGDGCYHYLSDYNGPPCN